MITPISVRETLDHIRDEWWRHRRRVTEPALPRAQCDERIEYPPVDLQALAECVLARAKCPLRRNADVIDAGLPWRCLDALDQLRPLPLERVGWPKEVGPEGDEQMAVVALGIRARAGKQSQRL